MARWRIGPYQLTLERATDEPADDAAHLRRAQEALWDGLASDRLTMERYELLIGRALERYDPSCRPPPRRPARPGPPRRPAVVMRSVRVELLIPERP